MSGIDFRGRRRFRDSDATERLSALLGEDRAAGGSHAARGREVWAAGTPVQEAAGPGSAPPGGSAEARPPGVASVPDSLAGHARTTGTAMHGAAIHNAAVAGAEAEPLPPSGEPSDGPEPPTAAHSDPGAHVDLEAHFDPDALSDPDSRARHREDVTVRRSLSRPALVLLCVVLLVALGAGCAALLRGGGDQDAVTVSATTSAKDSARGGDTRESSGASAGSPSGGTASDRTASADGSPGDSGSAGPPSGGSTGGVLTVHVVGEVRDPSVVTLSPGARVMDAVEAAGGFTPAAVKDRINLAENVVDGAQIVIPNRGNVDDVLAARTAPGGGSGGAGTNAPNAPNAPNAAGRPPGTSSNAPAPGDRSGGSTGAAPGALVNLNTATEAELEALPKVGPVLAQRIVAFRTQHGPFTSPEQLDDVSGVGPAMLEALLPLVTV